MPLRTTRPKQLGESRYIDYLEEFPCFKVSHTFNEPLIQAFVQRFPTEDIKCIQPREDYYGNVSRRWWRVKITAKNCLALLRWGVQSDYTFTPRALQKLDSVAKQLHEKKVAEEVGTAPTDPVKGPSI